MKWFALALLVLLVLSQYRLWFAEEGSLAELHRLQREIERQEAQNASLRDRNARFIANTPHDADRRGERRWQPRRRLESLNSGR